MPTLRTPRLTLVPLADEHLELEYELDSDPAVMRYLTGRAATREEAGWRPRGIRNVVNDSLLSSGDRNESFTTSRRRPTPSRACSAAGSTTRPGPPPAT